MGSTHARWREDRCRRNRSKKDRATGIGSLMLGCGRLKSLIRRDSAQPSIRVVGGILHHRYVELHPLDRVRRAQSASDTRLEIVSPGDLQPWAPRRAVPPGSATTITASQ